MRNPHLRRIVGIAVEPPGGGTGSSEDLIYAEQSDWTASDRAAINAYCLDLDIMQDGMKQIPFNDNEFPETDSVRIEFPGETITILDPADDGSLPVSGFDRPSPASGPMNRRERRAARAIARRKKR